MGYGHWHDKQQFYLERVNFRKFVDYGVHIENECDCDWLSLTLRSSANLSMTRHVEAIVASDFSFFFFCFGFSFIRVKMPYWA